MSITVRAERLDDPHHWVKLSLSARRTGEDERAVAYSNSFRCSVQPLDSEADGYHLEVWGSGILSGLGYVFRRSPITGVLVDSLEGQLGGEDMEGVAYAATVAGILAAANGISIPANKQWVIKEA